MARIFVAGAAGLVGQNLIPRLKAGGSREIVAVDKHAANLRVLSELHPDIRTINADLSAPGPWQEAVAGCDSLVLLQAQIGGLDYQEFLANNVRSTELLLDQAARDGVKYIVHVSSSVVNSAADDFYTRSKKAQEELFGSCAIRHAILRPTLMFGWFDRKHLGWLRRFMAKTPVFPIPGDGRYLRQPLYGGDFSAIVSSCLASKIEGAFNITGLEKIDYIDLIREIRDVTQSRTAIVCIPYRAFRLLLQSYALFDRDPPFTAKQLEALVTPDVFEVIDWPGIFRVKPTPLRAALEETFLHPSYANIALEF